MALPKAWVAWSSGKDSAWALHLARAEGKFEICGLLTTVTEPFDRVSMHGVREELLARQADALRLPVHRVGIPFPCPNEVYEAAMGRALARAREEDVSHLVFGDLFLEDIRAYRESRMRGTGITPVFPLWGRPTRPLAEEMISGGLRATIVCLDPKSLPPEFAGRTFDDRLLSELPAGVDPCGERGEFHTFVTDGPMLQNPIEVEPGPVVERDGFVFADLVERAAIDSRAG
jgi:uncharacterized protein (TIGR00290 family)